MAFEFFLKKSGITFSFTSSMSIVLSNIIELGTSFVHLIVHLRTSDLGLNRTANSNLGTSFIVDLD